MHAFLVVTPSKEVQEREIAKLLALLRIDPIDITKISPQNTIGIGEIREFKRKVALKPFKSMVKAVFIEEAQTLTTEAQNALLKTLEEPPANTIIILLVSTNADALLPTIVSRCQVIEVSASGNQQLAPSELVASSKQLVAIIEGEIGERLALVEEASKDRQTAIAWLTNMILTTRQKLLSEVAKNNNLLISKYLSILLSFQRAHVLLSTTNVNPRFTLEVLFLSISATII